MSKQVVAHFMLGNTYSYTDEIWVEQIELAVKTGLDGLSLNLGPEEWQFDQALRAAQLCPPHFKLFLSLDMNVLPSSTTSSASLLASKIVNFASCTRYLLANKDPSGPGTHQMTRTGKIVVSTFGGANATFGGIGWKGLFKMVEKEGFKLFFVPAFFLPPEKIMTDPLVDGTFSWNTAWPINGSGHITSDEDKPFLKSSLFKKRKPYMAAVSPCFFTHYGTEPPWGWNKSSAGMTTERDIGPIVGSQPGSEAWTTGFDHSGFLSLTTHFNRLYKSLTPNRTVLPSQSGGSIVRDLKDNILDEEQERLVIYYRTCRKEGQIREDGRADRVGKPDRAEQAEDLMTIHSILHQPYVLTITTEPSSSRSSSSECATDQIVPFQKGSRYLTVPFSPGRIFFTVSQASDTEGKVVGRLEGIEIQSEVLNGYNFNLCSKVLHIRSDLDD
ncbi:Glycoside hydrolase, family 71 [Phaffia rhodozyma]|uniref:Glycoside hydrolase, family 71 n=1 Tax=Phaffia rhodozyma TaxID=264483 RepID=A0A0F7SYC8_PHARH|nr:Glycoside hydrolase, family 71 [Phaffia rhodozyma]